MRSSPLNDLTSDCDSFSLCRFHPAIQRVKAIVDGGELGAIKSVEARLAIPRGAMKDGDIRFDLSLGGGALMDMGCKCADCDEVPTSC